MQKNEIGSCPVCSQGKGRIFAHKATPFLDHLEQYKIRVCENCGHGWTVGRQDEDYLARIYGAPFFQTSQQHVQAANAPISQNATVRARLLADRYDGKLLDVGCGTGVFLKLASQHFNVTGIEFSEHAAAELSREGFEVYQGDLMKLDILDTFNIITFWDVLASLPDPVAALKKTVSLLNPDGVICLTLPMIDSKIARLAGKRWPLLIPPVNLHYFSRNGLDLLAEQTGLSIVDVQYPTKKVALDFIMLKAVRSFGIFSMEKFVSRVIPSTPLNINLGDIAQVTFARNGET